ncbi:hypothetical protein, partial [Mesorhizobium sp.]|uniref:hypothetical protein n=1 Tax=Mesorhizobium sp. TaxID=1871066 RepID=UPI0025BC6C97
PVKNLAHSASFDSEDKDAPSKPGIKHLVDDAVGRSPTAWASKDLWAICTVIGENGVQFGRP